MTAKQCAVFAVALGLIGMVGVHHSKGRAPRLLAPSDAPARTATCASRKPPGTHPAFTPQEQAHIDEVQEGILALRGRPFWQYRSSAERFKIETALAELKGMGLQGSDLAKGVIEDPLDFLQGERRTLVEDSVGSLNLEIQSLEWDSLGEALTSAQVDALSLALSERHKILASILTEDEMKQFAARHSFAGDQLRERVLQLSEPDFLEVSHANYQFERAAEAFEGPPAEEAAYLKPAHDRRQEQIRRQLKDGFSRYERSLSPSYEGQAVFALENGFDLETADQIHDLTEALRLSEIGMAESGVDMDEQAVRLNLEAGDALAKVEQLLGPHYQKWLSSPAALHFVARTSSTSESNSE